MKLHKAASIALILWVFTIALFAWFFIRGNTTAGSDGRVAIVLKTEERNFVMTEMRKLLAAIQEILESANQGDIQRIIKVARSAGTSGTSDVNPSLITKLPLSFKQMGMSLHLKMDEIANAAEIGKPLPEILNMTSDAMTICVACHAKWQIIIGCGSFAILT